MILTGFGDEISPELKEQLEVMEGEGIKYLEIRGVWGKNILDLTDEELRKVKQILEDKGFKISAVGSPIGKIGIKDDFEEHLRKFRKALDIAKFLGTHYIRIFSYYIPENDPPEKWRDEVMDRMREKVKLAEREDIVLVHENERGIYGDIPSRCQDILKTINSPYLRANFDPANFVFENIRPYTQGYPLLRRYIAYVHVKDARHENGKVVCVPAGEGEGEMEEVLRSLKEEGYRGFLSLEPHLSQAGKFTGFSGPENFRIAVRALKKILKKLDIDYH